MVNVINKFLIYSWIDFLKIYFEKKVYINIRCKYFKEIVFFLDCFVM